MITVDEETVCSVCQQPFTEDQWASRHTDDSDGEENYHEDCCPECNGEE